MAETIIGKNVLESLTRSMYADSRCVYREYIQNAADQIDAAKQIHPELEYAVYVRIVATACCLGVEVHGQVDVTVIDRWEVS